MKYIVTLLALIGIISSANALDKVEDFEIEEVERLGRQIYEQDMLAAEATDVLFAQGLDLSEYPIRGWVVEEKKRTSVVTFIAEYDGDLFSVFEVKTKGRGKPEFQQLERAKLSDSQSAAFSARSIAMKNVEKPCSDRYNFVIIDNDENDVFLVYALAATIDHDAVLVGGHYRFTISSDGQTVLKSERLSNSCLTLSKSPDDMPEGSSLAALSMSHIVSERPLETHVFLNLLHELDLYIATADESIWQISKGKIEKFK